MCIFIGIDPGGPWAIECGVFLDSVSGERKNDGRAVAVEQEVTKMGQSTIHLRQVTPSSPLLTASAFLQIQQHFQSTSTPGTALLSTKNHMLFRGFYVLRTRKDWLF